MATRKTTSIYERLTEQVCEAIEASGETPWSKPWVGEGVAFPRNAKSGKAYRGVNVVALFCRAWAAGYRSGFWLTYKQARELGGQVRKGEKGTKIVFWKLLDDESPNAKEGDKVPLARGYTVFNAEQCDGLPAKFAAPPVEDQVPEKVDEKNAAAEALVAAHECPIRHAGGRACYSPGRDEISLPERSVFCSWAEFYTTAFHEMGHSTGHVSRLNRKFGATFGNHDYSREELVAEFTACFLAAHCGFARATLNNSAAYLRIWVCKLRDEPRMLATAAQTAQKAADRILERAGVALDMSAA